MLFKLFKHNPSRVKESFLVFSLFFRFRATICRLALSLIIIFFFLQVKSNVIFKYTLSNLSRERGGVGVGGEGKRERERERWRETERDSGGERERERETVDRERERDSR